MQELWFLCMTRRLNVLNKCMRFRLNICNGYQVIEQTQFCNGQTDRQTDPQTQGEKQYVSRPLHGGDIKSYLLLYLVDVLHCLINEILKNLEKTRSSD